MGVRTINGGDEEDRKKKTGWVEKNEKHNTLVELDYNIPSIAPNVTARCFFF